MNQIEEILQKESFFLTQNLDVERMSGWNETIPQRMLVEICQIDGLWDTSTAWFSNSRSLVQVEFQGICMNSKPNDNVKNPVFNELFIFPFDEEHPENNLVSSPLQMKLFITVLIVEGKGEVPHILPTNGLNEVASPSTPSE